MKKEDNIKARLEAYREQDEYLYRTFGELSEYRNGYIRALKWVLKK